MNKAFRAKRTRAKIHGTAERPRLTVHFSNKNIIAQVIDDDAQATLCYVTTMGNKMTGTKTEQAAKIGTEIAKKAKAKTYFKQLEQKIQHDASTIDNYMVQRVTILKNAAKLLDKAVDLDKDTFTNIAKARAGIDPDVARNELQTTLENIDKKINIAFEKYPELKAHQEIAAVMQQNSYLQQEITAAREVYNDTVNHWNTEIFSLWAKKYVAAKEGYTTRIPFTASLAMKQESEGVFF